MIGLFVCMVIVLACFLAIWQAAYRIKKLQVELDALEAEKERLRQQLREFKDFYSGLEIEEKKLTVECRSQSQELKRVQARIEELEEIEKKIEEHRNESPV